jgi:hypothetical protein
LAQNTLSPAIGSYAPRQVTVGLKPAAKNYFDVRLSFDATKLEVTIIASGAFSKIIWPKNKTILRAKSLSAVLRRQSGSGSVAVIAFKPKVPPRLVQQL